MSSRDGCSFFIIIRAKAKKTRIKLANSKKYL